MWSVRKFKPFSLLGWVSCIWLSISGTENTPKICIPFFTCLNFNPKHLVFDIHTDTRNFYPVAVATGLLETKKKKHGQQKLYIIPKPKKKCGHFGDSLSLEFHHHLVDQPAIFWWPFGLPTELPMDLEFMTPFVPSWKTRLTTRLFSLKTWKC